MKASRAHRIKQKKIIYEVEDRSFEITSQKRTKEKVMTKTKESLHELQDTIKRNNLCIIGVLEREVRERMGQKLI